MRNSKDLGGNSGSSSLRSPEPVPVSAHTGDDPGREKDGIDVAIAAFLGARLSGESIETATKNAEAMLDFFGIPRGDQGANQ